MRNDQRRELVGLMLPGLPQRRRAFETGKLADDADGAGFESLE